MSARRLWLIALALLALAGALYQASRLAPSVAANRERLAALHVLVDSLPSGNADELAWEAGWRSLCSAAELPQAAGSQDALAFLARAGIDRGDYAGALAEFRRVAAGGADAEAALASAYVAALEMRWLDAAQLYPGQPTPRHQRFWGTVFYLAAQELMFRGQTAEAAQWYRQADQSYGTQGPYLGLSLVDCLAQRGRVLEAFDAYRRGLVVLSPDEALAQRERFEQMRLDALRSWRGLDPANPQVAGWLDFYENDRPVAETQTLAEAPQPQVALAHDLGDGHRLIGFDYRPEDIATGPFMWVDLYVQEGTAEGDPVVRLRRAVLNQAPNGSFTWDAAPNGVRPFGWHRNLYSTDLSGIGYELLADQNRWLCMNGNSLQDAIGLESLAVSTVFNQHGYLQGGMGFYTGDRALTIGRTWFKDPAKLAPYSYLGGAFPTDEVFAAQGVWKPVTGTERVAVWLFSHATSKACGHGMFLLAYPDS